MFNYKKFLTFEVTSPKKYIFFIGRLNKNDL
jgi:hypothetical protein